MHKPNFFIYPPYPYLEQVAEHCPKAVATYMAIWKMKDKHCKVVLNKDEIRVTFLKSLAKFRHDLLLLVKEQLVNIDEDKSTIEIELIDWETEVAGFSLC